MLELNLKNKWILSLDVSISSGEITFLNCNDESSNTIMLDEEKKISESLLPQIQDTIKKLNLNTQKLCAIGFSTGPGSYMGLRIGISTAKGLSVSFGCPIYGFSSLEILAENAIRKYSRNSEFIADSLICIRSADKDNVFHAKFKISKNKNVLSRKTDDKLIPFNQLKIPENENTILVYSSISQEKIGPLEKKYKNILSLPINTSSFSLAYLTLNEIRTNKFPKNSNIIPTYCRDVKVG